MNKFSIIIASFNGEKYLHACLSSVFKTTYPKFEVIIVDDGSTDGSLQICQYYQKKHKITLIENKKNLGLVISRNKAINKSKGDILVFLDNDTEVDKNWLNALNQTFSSEKTIGAAQCKILDFNKRGVIQEIGMKLNPYTGFGMPLGRGQRDNGQFDRPEEIISLGAALAVKKEIAKEIDGFDQKLFHYTDDLDFSWRVWISGYRVVLAPSSRVYHYTKIHHPDFKLYYHLSKNSIRMITKNYEVLNIIRFLPFSIILNIAGGIYPLLTRGNTYATLGVLFGLIWNLFFLLDTLKQRNKVQRLRKRYDKDIFKKIMISTNFFSIFRLYFMGAKTTVSLMRR